MIKRIIEASARNRLLVLAIVAIVVALAFESMRSIPLDAIPDLSDTQVIVYSRWDRSPDIIEDQVTYPIITSLLGAPRVKTIRGFSDFGFSYVYVIFEDGTDLYWARSRVLEYLSKIQARLPEGVRTELGPDATGVGWVYQYALVDESGRNDLADLRSYQDWFLRYQLQAVPGVAEVASLGGFEKQYQVTVDPNKLAAYGLGFTDVAAAHPPARTTRSAAASSSCPAASTWSAGAATSRASPTSPTSSSRPTSTARRCASATWGRSRSGPTSAAASPISTARATPSAASSSCARARTRST